jgi:hypothetical protein
MTGLPLLWRSTSGEDGPLWRNRTGMSSNSLLYLLAEDDDEEEEHDLCLLKSISWNEVGGELLCNLSE